MNEGTQDQSLETAAPTITTVDTGSNRESMFDGLTKAAEQDTGTKPAPAESAPKPAAEPKKSLSVSDALKAIKDPSVEAPTAPAKAELSSDEIPKEYKKGSKAEEWSQLRQKVSESVSQAVQARQELDSYRQKAAMEKMEEVNKWKSEHENTLKELERVAIERSPRFNKEFQDRQAGLLEKIRHLVTPSEAEGIERLVKADPSDGRFNDLDQAVDKMTPFKQRQFQDLVSDFDRLRDERDFKIKESMNEWEKTQAESSQQVELEKQKVLQEFEKRSQRWLGLANTEDGDFNKSISNGVDKAREILQSEDLGKTEYADLALWAGVGPGLADLVGKLQTANAELAKKLEDHTNASGDFTSGNGITTGQTGTETLQGLGSVGERIMAGARKAGVINGPIIR